MLSTAVLWRGSQVPSLSLIDEVTKMAAMQFGSIMSCGRHSAQSMPDTAFKWVAQSH